MGRARRGDAGPAEADQVQDRGEPQGQVRRPGVREPFLAVEFDRADEFARRDRSRLSPPAALLVEGFVLAVGANFDVDLAEPTEVDVEALRRRFPAGRVGRRSTGLADEKGHLPDPSDGDDQGAQVVAVGSGQLDHAVERRPRRFGRDRRRGAGPTNARASTTAPDRTRLSIRRSLRQLEEVRCPWRESDSIAGMPVSAQYSVTIRVELDARQEPLGKLTAAIAEAGGQLQGVDLVPGAGPEGKRVRG